MMKAQLDKAYDRLTDAAAEVLQIALKDASPDTCYTVGRIFALIETTRMLIGHVDDAGGLG